MSLLSPRARGRAGWGTESDRLPRHRRLSGLHFHWLVAALAVCRACERDAACPISTEGWTRRVHFVREGGGGGVAQLAPAAHAPHKQLSVLGDCRGPADGPAQISLSPASARPTSATAAGPPRPAAHAAGRAQQRPGVRAWGARLPACGHVRDPVRAQRGDALWQVQAFAPPMAELPLVVEPPRVHLTLRGDSESVPRATCSLLDVSARERRDREGQGGDCAAPRDNRAELAFLVASPRVELAAARDCRRVPARMVSGRASAQPHRRT